MSEFDFTPDDKAALLILRIGLEAFDRMREAQAAIAGYGLTFLDRYGQPRVNPAFAVERDSRAAMLRCFKDLDLEFIEDDTSQRPPGRPPGPGKQFAHLVG